MSKHCSFALAILSIAAFAAGVFAIYYNYCWQTRRKGTSGKKRPTAAMMAGLVGHVWSFNELFESILNPSHL
ncbi:MAG: hypothetical protein WD875_12760 [Pirellulales bacterium]